MSSIYSSRRSSAPSMHSSTFIQGLLLAAPAYTVDPAAIYNGGYRSAKNVALRIGNGGAGQSGLIEGKYFHETYRSCHISLKQASF